MILRADYNGPVYRRYGVQTTRDHLIEIGLQRIHEIGYAATGVKEILDLAGVRCSTPSPCLRCLLDI